MKSSEITFFKFLINELVHLLPSPLMNSIFQGFASFLNYLQPQFYELLFFLPKLIAANSLGSIKASCSKFCPKHPKYSQLVLPGRIDLMETSNCYFQIYVILLMVVKTVIIAFEVYHYHLSSDQVLRVIKWWGRIFRIRITLYKRGITKRFYIIVK